MVFLGWRHGSREFGRLDAVCVTLAAEGVALLAVASWMPRLIPMSWAIAVSVATDFLAYLPTFHHAWRRPGEEPWLPYAMFGAAAALVLFVADRRVLAGVIYPDVPVRRRRGHGNHDPGQPAPRGAAAVGGPVTHVPDAALGRVDAVAAGYRQGLAPARPHARKAAAGGAVTASAPRGGAY